MDSATPDPNHAAEEPEEPEFPEFPANASSGGFSPQREPGAADSSNGASSWSAPPASAALTPVLSDVPHATRAPVPSELADVAVAWPHVDESPIEPRAEKPELIEHDYQPLLARLEAECRRVISAAETEAEAARSKAEDEARRIVADAHRERSSLLRAATSKQALLYQEAESEIQQWLVELEQEREAVLAAAREEADRRVRAMDNEADLRARERISAAESEAARIVADARVEASRRLGAEGNRPAADALPRTPDPASAASAVSGSESSAHVEPNPSTGGPGAHGSSDAAGETEAAPRAPSVSAATNGSTVLASRANGFVLPPPPSAAEESKESFSADSLERLLRGEDGTADAESMPGEPAAGLSSLVPTEPDAPEVSSEADDGTQPSASRRGRRRRHRFGRAQS